MIYFYGVKHMDFSTVTQFISTLGFPIAVCLICFWYINKREGQQREEIKELSTAINNNTLIMQKLYERMMDDEK